VPKLANFSDLLRVLNHYLYAADELEQKWPKWPTAAVCP
jgi:hypothetical protein